jgi:hypothetical protein
MGESTTEDSEEAQEQLQMMAPASPLMNGCSSLLVSTTTMRGEEQPNGTGANTNGGAKKTMNTAARATKEREKVPSESKSGSGGD